MPGHQRSDSLARTLWRCFASAANTPFLTSRFGDNLAAIMRVTTLLASVFLSLHAACAEGPRQRLLYMTSPDGAQGGGSGTGVLIFDLDQNYKLVRRIEAPIFKEGIRGFCACAKTGAGYYSTGNRRLGALDLITGQVRWEKSYDVGCDRAAVTPDGMKIYSPGGWWLRGEKSCWQVIDAATGAESKRIPVENQAHNTIASLDGKFVYGGSLNEFRQISATDDSVVRLVKGIGEGVVYPFTVRKDNKTAYICLGKHVGFEVVDLEKGEIRHRVLAGAQPISHRTHGAGLTIDERELWISDQDGNKLWIFDVTQEPPKPAGHVELSQPGHGWVTFSLDGKHAWCHTPDVIDTKTRQIVATLKDEKGQPFCSSKFIEVHIQDGKVVAVGDQFGLGR